MQKSKFLTGVTLVAAAGLAVLTILVTGAMAGIAAKSGNPGIAPPAGRHWYLTWHDEFNKGKASLKGWHYDLGGGGWGNNEQEVYTKSARNAFVAQGCLNIQVIGRKFGGRVRYTSARITTRNIFNQKYGLFVFRARLPKGRGLWPAIWMMPQKSVFGAWPQSGEIDIMESRGNWVHHVQGSLHSGNRWNQDNTQTKIYRLPHGQSATGWHTYALEWEPVADPHHPAKKLVRISWFVDGYCYETRQGGWTVPQSDASHNPNAPFNHAFHLILNMAVGGNYVGGKTPGPGRYAMRIAYIRAYGLTGH